MAKYQVWYERDDGTRLEPITMFTELEYVRVVGDVGLARIVFPKGKHAIDIIPDRRLSIWRIPDGGSMALEAICFLRLFNISTNRDGLTYHNTSGGDLNDLLGRRIIAYYAETSQAKKTDQADDMIKALVRENLGSSSTTDYDGNAITGRDMTQEGLSVQADLAAGPSITKAFAWRDLLPTLQEIQATSRSEGTEVFFGIVPTSPTAFAFETKTGQWGSDRTADTGASPIRFSLEAGNLANPTLSYNYRDEENFIYGLGQGEASDREIQEASDSARIGVSQFGRIEGTVNATQSGTAAGVSAAAKDKLARSRPVTAFSGEILSTPGTPYGGQGWNLGDKVTVDYLNLQLSTVIRSIHVRIEPGGKETVTARVEA